MILDDILVILRESNNKAYTTSSKSYTYKELYKFVCNIYNYINKNNKEKKPIIVYGNKEVYMKASFLACSYAGITYVPIDISMPQERVESIIKQVKPYCIIGEHKSEMCENISKEKIYNIMETEAFEEIDKIYMKPEDIYYIIFTSGSTGIPKGVKVTYKNLDTCIKWLKEITKTERGVILNQAIYSFDLSVADLYLSLISESEHFIIENDTKLDFSKMFEQLKSSNATHAVMTPSFADLLLIDKGFGRELLPKLNTILFCGEKLLGSTVEKLYSRFGDINIINSYGPTECTFAVTSIELTKEMAKLENIPVGKPKNDVDIVILDENKNEMPEKQIGEILIVGESVADGYLENNESKTFITYNNKKAYITGDLGYKENGVLYYDSRKDNQIKYKGYRIELSDIERNLYNLKYIEKAKVIANKDKNGNITKINAFVKLSENKSVLEVKKDLSEMIPQYMIPSIKILDKFPINKNGKIDIERLREIVDGR